jgi:SSS family solute:Na+ symporter
MNVYISMILAYLLALTVMNFWKSRRVKSQDDMMVAGRSLTVGKMVFTLVCTWIGSGTFIGGAEFASKAGWSAMWQPAGAYLGILVIYFLAAKIRTFGQYTVGDILEARYGALARVVGAVAIFISFTTIVSYQFRAGGYILNVISDGAIGVPQGQFMAALFVILFTVIGGMIAVTNTDLPNGIIIVSSTVLSTPLVIWAAGGWRAIRAVLPASHFQVISSQFGGDPYLKIPAIALSTFLLLMGVQSMYQKFYSARTPRDAKKAVGLWLIGTVVVESVVIVMAIFASARFWKEIQTGTMDPASVILQAAKRMIPMPVGVLLLGAATAVVISTGMNYLLSPTTTLMRDVYHRFVNRDAPQRKVILLQKLFIVLVGVLAYVMATRMSSVLENAYFAYTLYGVVITPALIAALASKRVTKAAGVASIVLGTVVTVFLKLSGSLWPQIMRPLGDANADPFGIPIIYPGLAVSLLSLLLVSLFTRPPDREALAKFFPEDEAS